MALSKPLLHSFTRDRGSLNLLATGSSRSSSTCSRSISAASTGSTLTSATSTNRRSGLPLFSKRVSIVRAAIADERPLTGSTSRSSSAGSGGSSNGASSSRLILDDGSNIITTTKTNGPATSRSSRNGAAASSADKTEYPDYSMAIDDPGSIQPPPSVSEFMSEVGFFLQPGDEGPPRFFCPIDAKPRVEGMFKGPLPRLFFLPGIEGTGYGLKLQHRSLSSIFEVSSLHVPLADRTDFQGLVDIVSTELDEEHRVNPDRALFLVGESFGGVLALAVAAARPDLPITLVLVNPATSFPRSPLLPLIPLLTSAPAPIFQAAPFALSFVLGNPLRMATSGFPLSLSPLDEALKLRESLLGMIPTLPVIGEILPQETLKWKIHLLQEGSRKVEPLLPSISNRTLILASEEDNMLPSAEEASRLKKAMTKSAKCITRKFADSGHTLLLEGGFDLASVIKGAGMYRKSSSPREDQMVDSYVPPSLEDVARVQQGLASTIRRFCSPVFISTDDADSPLLGLDGIPSNERPILFIGNHQTYAPDLTLLVSELLARKGILMRGLAHPMALGLFEGQTGDGAGMADAFRVFGAVPVSGRAMFKLMRANEAMLLFPGGAREALKRRGEEYQLFWPDRAEFVRMAIKFGATIVPFAAVGCDDGYNFVLDGEEILQTPWLGQQAREFLERVPRVRDETAGPAEESFVAPIVLPKQLNRMYFLFKKPIRTRGLEHLIDDKEAIDGLYRKVKQDVEDGLGYLLAKREEDPYKDAALRLLYEASWEGKRQAPTFEL